MNPIALHLDRSDTLRGLCFERDGQRVSLDEAFAEGFTIRPEDAPAILTMAATFIENRDQFQK